MVLVKHLLKVRIFHTNIESSIINNGHSTGYFQLHRGTRQGDPLAPYLFILVIEILACLVNQNQNTKGININGTETKMCLFADDSTFFLSDIKSLRELKITILSFSKYSSLEVNYEKSEAAWIGLEKEKTETPEGIKWVNLCRKSIKILGIHFSYDKKVTQQNNFDRVFSNLETIINIWKGRYLTLYGKSVVLKTLAIPKILYVTSVLEVPSGFVNKVKSVILKFLWSGRKHKIKYTALIGSFCNGGIEFPDIKSRLETQRIMCIKRLVEQGKTKTSPWKHIPLHHLNDIGGARGIRTNFNIKLLSRHIPSFYKSCLSD